MTNSDQVTRTARNMIAWEARWVPVVLGGVGLGLLLGMGYDNWDAAAACLFSVCAVSSIVRWQHYSKAA
jgi:hypothetical protein